MPRAALIRLALNVGRLVGLALTILGIAGAPDNYKAWVGWINAVVSDPLVVELAQKAVQLATFVNRTWVRTVLVVAGVLLFIWPLAWFWRLRHRVAFWWRRLLEEEVWTDAQKAFELVRNSEWARSREPSVSVLDGLTARAFISGGSSSQSKLRMFNHFCRMALRKFAEDNPSYRREVADGTLEYREDKLRRFLDNAYDEDTQKAFGDVPSGKV